MDVLGVDTLPRIKLVDHQNKRISTLVAKVMVVDEYSVRETVDACSNFMCWFNVLIKDEYMRRIYIDNIPDFVYVRDVKPWQIGLAWTEVYLPGQDDNINALVADQKMESVSIHPKLPFDMVNDIVDCNVLYWNLISHNKFQLYNRADLVA